MKHANQSKEAQHYIKAQNKFDLSFLLRDAYPSVLGTQNYLIQLQINHWYLQILYLICNYLLYQKFNPKVALNFQFYENMLFEMKKNFFNYFYYKMIAYFMLPASFISFHLDLQLISCSIVGTNATCSFQKQNFSLCKLKAQHTPFTLIHILHYYFILLQICVRVSHKTIM